MEHVVDRRLAVLGAPDRLQLLVARRARPLAREGQVAHFDAALVQLRDFGVQLLAVRAGGVGEHGDVRPGFALGREHHHLLGRDGVDGPGDRGAFRLLGEVDRLAVLHLVDVALHDELAVGAGIEDAAALQLDLVDALQRAGGDRLDGQVGLQGMQGTADRLVRLGGQCEGAGEAEGRGSQKSVQTHEKLP
ncbi:hypothetical protein D3C76_1121550 [compost metagenome]